VALIALVTACGGPAVAPDPRPIGVGPRYTLVAGAVDAPGLVCGPAAAASFSVHLELFADGFTVLVPSGIGIRPPWRGDVPYVTGGACEYPLVTREPTGLIEVARSGMTLGDLFAVWGAPLSRDGFAHFAGTVTAHVDGRRVDGPPGAIPLVRHAQIVLQVGHPKVVAHETYSFPPGR
jgi:hypothetical protein